MAKVSVFLSRKVSDGEYGSFESTIGIEDDVPQGTDQGSFAAGLRAWCKAFLDETLAVQRREYLHMPDMVGFEPAPRPNAPTSVAVRPPAAIRATVTEDALEPSRVPIDDAGNEYDIFVVDKLRIESTSTGTKVGKALGGKWRRHGVMVWPEVMEALIGSIADLDVGQEFGPPKPGTKAKALLNEKGSPSKVVEWL